MRLADVVALLRLVRNEAKTLGYGTTYHDDNYSQWPRRLKDLRRLANRLWEIRITIEGMTDGK